MTRYILVLFILLSRFERKNALIPASALDSVVAVEVIEATLWVGSATRHLK